MFGNVLVTVFSTYYTIYIVSLIISRKRRKGIQAVNKRLEKLRTVAVKSVDEQKEFINLKYPKRGKFKFSMKMIPYVLMRIIIFVSIYLGYTALLKYFGVSLLLWQGILAVIIGPILINLTLEKFGVQKSSLLVFFRRAKNE